MRKFGFFVVLLAILAPPSGWAWSEHHQITRIALGSGADGKGTQKLVEVRPLSELLQSLPELVRELEPLGYPARRTLNETIRIRKEYAFPFQAGETVGRPVAALEVLSVYSDEPDWRMDQELFGEDQYPELWRSEYSMMGGKKGTSSQAFRHMYWPAFSIKEPSLSTVHLPPQQTLQPMGTAPERAAVFIALARAARKLGHEYWSIRFVGNALHYLEDVAQPFHSSQVPYAHFALMPVLDLQNGAGLQTGVSGVFVRQVTNIISYYHFAYEGYIGRRTPEFSDALTSGMGMIGYLMDPAGLVAEMAGISSQEAKTAGKAAYDFFPRIETRYLTLDSEALQDEAWWQQVELRAKDPAFETVRSEYFGSVNRMFTVLGDAVRKIVSAESDRPIRD